VRTTRFLPLLLAFPAFLAFFQPTVAQNDDRASVQGLSLLRQSLSAMAPSGTTTDVTLSGTARRIAGSDDETGTAVLKGLASGAARTDLSLSSGRRSEVQNLSTTAPAGSWSGPDGVAHAMAFHNLLTEPSWFFPAFAISRRLSATGYVVTYVGHETRNGRAVEHVAVSQTPAFPDPPDGPTFAHLTQIDFFLDSTTFLPVAIAFNIHPDNNALLDLPIEVRFSDYRSFNGAQIPFHVQRFLNNGLILDFQAQTATLNTGLSAGLFNIQ
jgi:hypothetical protein